MKIFLNKLLITENHYRLIMYLFTKESLPLLSAYEVYNFTWDEEEFLDTLFLIEKIEFFNKKVKLDEVCDFDIFVEEQLKILFLLKSQLS